MRRLVFLAMVLLGAGAAVGASEHAAALRGADAELAREPSWTVPTLDQVRHRAVAWAGARGGPAAADRVEAIWERAESAGGPGDVVTTAFESVAVVDPRAADVRAGIDGGDLDAGWLASLSASDFGRQAVALWLARELVRRDRFDEALPLLADLDVADSVDPAALLFHRGCCQHWLLDLEAAVESFERLLEREEELPARYSRLARLLRADIAAVETGSLDHVARRMRDVRRRLAQGRAGPETRRVQRGVVESLDKLIEELERQQRQQSQAAAAARGGGQGGAAGRPMDESRLARGSGKGEVRSRELGAGDGWGDLPPHEREAALQQIDREYPSHYREAIEEYFRRLATGVEDAP